MFLRAAKHPASQAVEKLLIDSKARVVDTGPFFVAANSGLMEYGVSRFAPRAWFARTRITNLSFHDGCPPYGCIPWKINAELAVNRLICCAYKQKEVCVLIECRLMSKESSCPLVLLST
jgi:hypothetical protein